MARAMSETERRRKIQQEYNEKHGITPQSVKKKIREGLGDLFDGNPSMSLLQGKNEKSAFEKFGGRPEALVKEIEKLRKKMKKASEDLEFEEAAKIRDEIKRLQILDLSLKSGSVEKEENEILPEAMSAVAVPAKVDKK
jgi:excinuclease ABC subunit B